MNSEGGKLLVGVEDNGTICGIQKEFETFKDKKNWDGWLQHFTNLIDNHILGSNVMMYIKSPRRIPKDGKLVVLIEVEKSSKGVYVKYRDNKGQDEIKFYRRAFNTTRLVNTNEIVDYTNKHWELKE